MKNVLGIISFDDASVEVVGLGEFRPIPSLSFLGRYRLIDFILSNYTNSGIKDIQVYVKRKPRSVIEHLGTGRQYNINSKHGRLRILTGEGPVQSEAYNHDVTAYLQNIEHIEHAKGEMVVVAPSHMIYTVDFRDVMKAHEESAADVTVLYKTVNNANTAFIGADTITLDANKRVTEIEKNRGKFKNRNISLAAYVMSKELFITMVHLADNLSSFYTLRDALQEQVKDLKMMGYSINGYVSCINSLQAYFNSNQELLDEKVSASLFSRDWPIHTRTNDSCPTRYTNGSKVTNALIANGCLIEGEVRNSVIGRGVVINKGVLVENSIILADSIVGENVHIKNAVVDKDSKITRTKELIGKEDQVMYVNRGDRI